MGSPAVVATSAAVAIAADGIGAAVNCCALEVLFSACCQFPLLPLVPLVPLVPLLAAVRVREGAEVDILPVAFTSGLELLPTSSGNTSGWAAATSCRNWCAAAADGDDIAWRAPADVYGTSVANEPVLLQAAPPGSISTTSGSSP
jgi:hypothetical protein